METRINFSNNIQSGAVNYMCIKQNLWIKLRKIKQKNRKIIEKVSQKKS